MRWTLLLIAIVAGLALLPDAAPSMKLVDGELELQNSLEGQPLLTADNVGPGDSTSGTVTLSNTGTLAGSLSLTPGDVSDTGGPLSGHLQLRVEDLTAGTVVWTGPLAGMGTLPLGTLAPGASRAYRLTASLPAGATQTVAASETTLSYTWTATDAPVEPPDPPGPPVNPPRPPPSDGGGPSLRQPLRLRVYLPARQRLVASGKLLVYVRCDQVCWLAGRARVAVHGGVVGTRQTRTGRVRARREARMVLRLRGAAAKAVKRSLSARGQAAVRVTITGRTGAGARSTTRKRMRIAAPRTARDRSAGPRRVASPRDRACGARAAC